MGLYLIALIFVAMIYAIYEQIPPIQPQLPIVLHFTIKLG